VGWKRRVAVLAAGLWWGSLCSVGFIVVPLLFAHLPSPELAGQTAARLFTAQTWVSMACGVLLMMAARSESDAPRMDWGRGSLVFVFGGVLLALLSQFAVAPHIQARENLRLWHGVGTAMYALQWLCALIVFWKLSAGDGRPGFPPPRE